VTTIEGAGDGWHTIKVDGEVWEAIHADAKPFVDHIPNDVLRRRLLTETMSASGTAAPLAAPARKRGALKTALDKGTLFAGEVLICEQPRRKRRFRAKVTSDGWIAVTDPDIGEFSRPSPALRACTGSQINGWGYWVVDRTGEVLETYRR
jgi:hypothetical protein